MAKEKEEQAWLLKKSVDTLNWVSSEIIKTIRAQKDILVSVQKLDYQIKNNLILLKDVPDRISSLVEEINELKK